MKTWLVIGVLAISPVATQAQVYSDRTVFDCTALTGAQVENVKNTLDSIQLRLVSDTCQLQADENREQAKETSDEQEARQLKRAARTAILAKMAFMVQVYANMKY